MKWLSIVRQNQWLSTKWSNDDNRSSNQYIAKRPIATTIKLPSSRHYQMLLDIVGYYWVFYYINGFQTIVRQQCRCRFLLDMIIWAWTNLSRRFHINQTSFATTESRMPLCRHRLVLRIRQYGAVPCQRPVILCKYIKITNSETTWTYSFKKSPVLFKSSTRQSTRHFAKNLHIFA